MKSQRDFEALRKKTRQPRAAATEGYTRDYWTDLDQARLHYHKGEHAEVEQAVSRLLARIEDERGKTADVLRGSAYTLLGRILDDREEEAEARQAFEQAVRWFGQALDAPAQQPGRVYSDYGWALYKVEGRDREARENLERALELGYTHASTYRHLGYTLLRLEAYREAEEKLRLALELTPGSTKALKALAESIKAQERWDDAAAVLLDLVWLLVPAGDLDKARSEAKRALELSTSPMTQATMGSVLRLSGRDKEGAEYLQAAAANAPEMAWVHVELGEALWELDRLDEAREALDRALEIEPNDSFALARMAELLQPDEALPLLEQALEQAPDDIFALNSKAEALIDKGSHQEALSVLERVLELDRRNAFALALKGLILRQRGESEQAVGLLRTAVKREPEEAWMQAELGAALRDLGKLDKALEATVRALELQPDDASTLASNGDTLRMLGELDKALENLDQALEIEPENAFALARKGEILRVQGHRDEASSLLDRVLEVESDDPFALASKAEILRTQGHEDEAMEILDHVLEEEPHYAFALVTKAQILRDSGELEEARELLQLVLATTDVEDDPSLAWVHGELGLVLWQQGDFEEALAAFEQSRELAPGNALMLALEGEMLCTRGFYGEALELLDEALEHDPDLAFALGAKGNLLIGGAEYSEANQLLEKATARDPDDPWLWWSKAFTLQYLEKEVLGYLEKGEAACRAGIRAASGHENETHLRALLGDYLCLQGCEEAADREYKQVVEQEDTTGLDPDTLARVGWCHYQLGHRHAGHWDAAVRHLATAVRSGSDMTFAQFDLVLALMCGGRRELAVQEFGRAMEMARSKHPFRRRGLFHVALADLKEALQEEPELEKEKELQQIRERLETELEKVADASPTDVSPAIADEELTIG